MMKKARVFSGILLLILILSMTGCKGSEPGYHQYEEADNYENTVEFFIHYDGGSRYNGWRFIYDQKENRVYPVTNENLSMGDNNFVYINPVHIDQIRSLKELGQLNDYKCYGETAFALYWNWGGNTNTLVCLRDGVVSKTELQVTESLRFANYDAKNDRVYLTDILLWNEEKTRCAGKFYIVDVEKNRVTTENICTYSEELEKQYNISAQLRYPIKDWDKSVYYNMASIDLFPLDKERLGLRMSCGVGVEDKNYVNTSFFFLYDLTTHQITDMKVADEIICGIRKTNAGFWTCSEEMTLAEDSKDRYVKRIWFSEYDNNFNFIRKTEVDPSGFLQCNRVIAYHTEEQVFIFGEKPKDENILGVWNAETQQVAFADGMPTGFICSDRVVKKENGMVINVY